MKKLRSALIVLLCSILVLTTLVHLHAEQIKPSDEEQAAFDQTKRAGTKQAYRSFLQSYPEGALYWVGRQAIEDIIIDEITKKRVGKRFVVKEISPQNGSPTGSMTVKSIGDNLQLLTLYPKDSFEATVGTSGIGRPSMYFGNKSIWRFIGRVTFLNGCIFEGSEREPLSFMLLDSVGFVYLDGKGTVIVKDRQTELPLVDSTLDKPIKKPTKRASAKQK